MNATAAQPARRDGGRKCRIGIDVGGTFTDFVLVDMASRAMTRFKEPSVPGDPSLSIERGLPALIARAGVTPADIELIVHGTTLLVNAIIQRRGARIALVVSKGNRGILEIGRANLAHTQDFTLRKEEPLVTRDLIFETSARLKADGTVVAEADQREFDAIAQRLKAEGVDAVAVQLLHSFRFPDLERQVAEALRARLPDVPVTESAHIWPELGEFERSLVSLMNAYVQPIMDAYLARLTERVKKLGVSAPIYITASNGGTITVETAVDRPIDTILSGPASGVVAATRAADVAGIRNLVTIDMGGTSCDVSVVLDGEPSFTTLSHVGEFPLILPVLDVSAIGAGGGSIIWVDAQGVLKIGPRSAGADPGPVCYSRGGTEPTVTDCYLLVGYIDPKHFLGGRMALDRAAAERALDGIADQIGLEGPDRAVWAASAALQVTTAVMAAELNKGLARRGEDPRDFALMAFGGAGPTHANLLAVESGLSSLIVPPASSTFCALGAILADVKRDYVRSHHVGLDQPGAAATLKTIFRELEADARAWIEREGDLLGRPEFLVTLEMHYTDQAFELQVTLPDALRVEPDEAAITELFHQAHEKLYGFRDRDSSAEVTTQRLQVIGRMPPIEFPEAPAGGRAEAIGRRRVYHEGTFLEVPVYDRKTLGRDATVKGPAIVEQEDGTTWIVPGWNAAVDRIGNLLVEPAARGG